MRERAGNVSRQLVLDFSFCNQFGANSFQNSFCFAIGKVIRIVVCRCNFNQPIDLKIVPYQVRSRSWSVLPLENLELALESERFGVYQSIGGADLINSSEIPMIFVLQALALDMIGRLP